ncbi:hypothetical protein [Cytophaga aurantiaca]|uniref:hypothetical protein n=1 Tax=Cytophaga aurantiaca TaxID=29530 RepID=UPI0003A0648D|nr:hypothetical protein [Cytophaga aurantiaca]
MIKNNYFSIRFIILLICVTCISCDRSRPVTTYGFSQDFKNYTVFNTGSYWVYEDSASKTIDSIYLVRHQFSFIEEIDGTMKYQYLEEWKHSSLNQSTLFFKGYIPSGETKAMYAETVPPILNPGITYFDGEIGTAPDYTYNIYYEEKRNSISFQETFHHVKVFLSFYQQYPNHAKRWYYANHIGLVRKELYNGQVWNLIRYHVSQ